MEPQAKINNNRAIQNIDSEMEALMSTEHKDDVAAEGSAEEIKKNVEPEAVESVIIEPAPAEKQAHMAEKTTATKSEEEKPVTQS